MTCKGICNSFKQPDRFGGSPYRAGYLFCSACGPADQDGIFIDPAEAAKCRPDWNGKNCPCCGRHLKCRLSDLVTVRA